MVGTTDNDNTSNGSSIKLQRGSSFDLRKEYRTCEYIGSLMKIGRHIKTLRVRPVCIHVASKQLIAFASHTDLDRFLAKGDAADLVTISLQSATAYVSVSLHDQLPLCLEIDAQSKRIFLCPSEPSRFNHMLELVTSAGVPLKATDPSTVPTFARHVYGMHGWLNLHSTDHKSTRQFYARTQLAGTNRDTPVLSLFADQLTGDVFGTINLCGATLLPSSSNAFSIVSRRNRHYLLSCTRVEDRADWTRVLSEMIPKHQEKRKQSQQAQEEQAKSGANPVATRKNTLSSSSSASSSSTTTTTLPTTPATGMTPTVMSTAPVAAWNADFDSDEWASDFPSPAGAGVTPTCEVAGSETACVVSAQEKTTAAATFDDWDPFGAETTTAATTSSAETTTKPAATLTAQPSNVFDDDEWGQPILQRTVSDWDCVDEWQDVACPVVSQSSSSS